MKIVALLTIFCFLLGCASWTHTWIGPGGSVATEQIKEECLQQARVAVAAKPDDIVKAMERDEIFQGCMRVKGYREGK